jgi:hypothetical protein
MKTFHVTSPSICGLLSNDSDNRILAYFGYTGLSCYVNAKDGTSFEAFTTEDAAKTRALQIQPDYRNAELFGDTEETNDDIA